MPADLAPRVRTQFAKRLKALRTKRGFERARYFAKSLGIEENRYTRYERAEVEPSLTLIHKICSTLQVTPNELLGFSEPEEGRLDGAPLPPPGFAEPPAPRPRRQADVGEAAIDSDSHVAKPGQARLNSLAWRLASATSEIKSGQHKKPEAADPLGAFRDTAALFQRLRSDPFATVSEIVSDPELQTIDAGRKKALADLIAAFTKSVSEAALSKG
jgi:transcriptional regulator with XRE-family HTH domain